jgi:hypothetical protein
MQSEDNMNDIDELLRSLDKEFPLVPHTGAGRLLSTVRRMKAEKELGVPINRRTGFAISVKKGKPANELQECKWEEFYLSLCDQLKRDYPDLYKQLFP